MRLIRLELQDFRSYQRTAVEFPRGVTVLVGPNAQGKTNLIEAIHRVSTGTSHRVAGDVHLVREGADAAVVRAAVATDAGRRRTIELELAPGRGGRTRVDGQDVRRSAEAVGVLRTVLFAPEDLAIVRGDPSGRRRFLDELLTQRRPAFAAARRDFERVLRQRNRLLRSMARLGRPARATADTTLGTWTAQLAEHASAIVAARVAAVHALAGPLARSYERVAGAAAEVRLTYRSSTGRDVEGVAHGGAPERSVVHADLVAALQRRSADEIGRGTTLIGPHRDDVELRLGGLPARSSASQGEAWSLALALRLASIEVLAEVGDHPVVLLDDVFAQLDEQRRARLAAACADREQVIVTAAVEDDAPLGGVRFDIRRDHGSGSTVHPRPAAAGGAA